MSTDPPALLTEDDVLDAVQDHLRGQGWKVVSRATATERGLDLEAQRGERLLIVEAKGAGSSKEGSARYGKSFTKSQVFDHVAKAILKAMRVVGSGDALAAIALPDNEDHRREVRQVEAVLRQIGVGVFWVADGTSVTLDPPWEL